MAAATTSLLLFFLLLPLLISSAIPAYYIRWVPFRPACNGTIGECSAVGDEFGLDSETNNRLSAEKNSIGYDAMRRGAIPCSRRGGLYGNCRLGEKAHPCSRGRSSIDRCRR